MSTWQRYRKQPWAMVGLVFLLGLCLVALLADFIASDKPILIKRGARLYWFPNLRQLPELNALRNDDFRRELTQGTRTRWAWFPLIEVGPKTTNLDRAHLNAPPSRAHWLGTDDTGRDIAARIVHGSRISLFVGVGSVLLYLIVGTAVGFVGGYYRGTFDLLLSRCIDVVLAFPALVLVLAISGLSAAPSVTMTLLAIAMVRWAGVAQLVRGEVLRLSQSPFIFATKNLGASDWRIFLRHVLPNLSGLLSVTATFGVAAAILIEGFISFLGFGGTSISWGVIFAHADLSSLDSWWVATFPGLALFLTVLGYHFVGHGLELALDARSDQRETI